MHRHVRLSAAPGGTPEGQAARGRIARFCAVLFLGALLTACAGDTAGTTDIADLPATTADDFDAHLRDLDKPALVNVWASWCLPCRSEAPLLDLAHSEHGDAIEFIGVDVQDSQAGAKEFLDEFGLEFDHFFDRSREIPNFYGGIGTPITMFFAPGGELVTIHNGVIDERTLALNLDELLQTASR